MSESEGGFVPEEAIKPKLDKHGEIVNPNKKPESKIGHKVSGWVALARHGYRLWRTGNLRPTVSPGQVSNNLEELRNKLDQAKPFEPSTPIVQENPNNHK